LPVFIREGGAFVAPVDLSPGKWVLRIQALAADGTPFRQQRQLFVKG
jgi:nitrogen fixation protein FixH